jgi:Tetratricopeptide repeat
MDEVAEQFRHDLLQLRQMAGKPSYSDLERASQHRLRRATVSDVLAGKRLKLPDWRFVSAFVMACRQLADENGLDSAELGTVADWKSHWDSAVAGHISARFPGRGLRSDPPERLTGADHMAEPPPPSSPTPGQDLQIPAKAPSPGSVIIGGEEPSRTSGFVGRRSYLAGLHTVFTGNSDASPLVLQGLGGIGKTQLAIEYAYRYANQYDLIWWIPCDTMERAEASITELESQLGIVRSGPRPEGRRFAELFDALRTGRPYQRWLLLFDDANAPDEIRDLIPPGPGHVLITSRNSRWNASDEMLELDVFARTESVEFLQSRMHWLSEVDAHRLADAVGDLPLILEHAVGSQLSVDEYIERLKTDPIGLFSADQPALYKATVAKAWRETLRRLEEENPDALNLLRRLAFFGPGPIPLESLEQGRHIREISLHSLLSDSIHRGRAISALGRAGVLRIDHAARTVNVHRVTQCIVRATLTDDQAALWRHDVHLLLTAADPGNPEDSDNWPRYNELRDHMAPSHVESCHNATVRRLIVNFVSYLRASGDSKAALYLVNRMVRNWPREDIDKHGDDLVRDYSLQAAKVEILLSLGKYQAAFSLRKEIVDAMGPPLGHWSTETAILGRAVGLELRLAGQFSAALNADNTSAEHHINHLGYDHPQTFMAMSNQATDYALLGHYDRSMQIAETVYRNCRSFYHGADHPYVLFYQNLLSRHTRMAGRYIEALELASKVCDGYRAAGSAMLPSDHPWILEHKLDHAEILRDMRLTDASRYSGLEAEVSKVHGKFWEMFGVANPQTLAAAVTICSLKRATGRTGEAAREISEARRLYQRTLGAEHPYTLACAAFLASMHRLTGAPEDGVTDLDVAIAGLTGTVGESHPYTLAAVTALVNALVDVGSSDAALSVGQVALERCRLVLGPDHPHTLACAAGVAAALSGLGREGDAAGLRADIRDRYARTLGTGHPAATLFAAGALSDPDFTPIPL